jgi:hypothetical protein
MFSYSFPSILKLQQLKLNFVDLFFIFIYEKYIENNILQTKNCFAYLPSSGHFFIVDVLFHVVHSDSIYQS